MVKRRLNFPFSFLLYIKNVITIANHSNAPTTFWKTAIEATLISLLGTHGWTADSSNNNHLSFHQCSQIGPTAPHAHYFRSTSPLPT